VKSTVMEGSIPFR